MIEFKKLTTKRLLAFYKAERKRYIAYKQSFTNDYQILSGKDLELIKEREQYLLSIKIELNKREHIKKEKLNDSTRRFKTI